MSLTVAGKPVNVAWCQQQQQQPVSLPLSSSSMTVTDAGRVQLTDSNDVVVELNTPVNNDEDDDTIVVDQVQRTSKASYSRQ